MKRCLVFLVACAVLCVGLGGEAAAVWAEPLRVLVTVAPQRVIVERVAGERAQVVVLIPPGTSPHLFEPKPSLMAEVAHADLYFSVGLEFEKVWLPKFRAANPGLKVMAMDAGIDKLSMTAHEHPGETAEQYGAGQHSGTEVHDPHVWLSPELVKTMARTVRDALTQADADGADLYATNCEAFVSCVSVLQRDLQAQFADVASRRFMVFHPSWGYFAREFKLIQMPVEAEGSEPGPRELAELIAEAKEHGVRVVFVSPQFSRKAAAVIARELGGGLMEADPLAEDWAGNLRRVAARMARVLRDETVERQ